MGSISWSCVAPFGDDAATILTNAQKEALRNGDYGKPYARGKPRAQTVEALRRVCSEEGTCSIIDVLDLGDAPGPARAGPFAPDILKRALGTVRPSIERAREGRGKLLTELGRGEAAYVICYEDGRPNSVLFLGWSFD